MLHNGGYFVANNVIAYFLFSRDGDLRAGVGTRQFQYDRLHCLSLFALYNIYSGAFSTAQSFILPS